MTADATRPKSEQKETLHSSVTIKSGCSGCFWTLAVVVQMCLIPVVTCGLLFLIPSLMCALPNLAVHFFNVGKWHITGSSNYNFTVNVSDGHTDGTYRLSIRNGRVSKTFLIGSCYECLLTINPQFTDELSVDTLFKAAFTCHFDLFCQVVYNPQYGYPENIGADFFGNSYGTSYDVKNFQIIDSP